MKMLRKFVNRAADRFVAVRVVLSVVAILFAFALAFGSLLRPALGLLLMALAFSMAFTVMAFAQTDMSSTLTSLGGYWTTAEGIGIGVLLFVVGRKIVKKI